MRCKKGLAGQLYRLVHNMTQGLHYVALRTSYSEPFCVSNCIHYVAYVACAKIDKSSILAYVRKET